MAKSQIISNTLDAQPDQTKNVNNQDMQRTTEGEKVKKRLKKLWPANDEPSAWILYPYI